MEWEQIATRKRAPGHILGQSNHTPFWKINKFHSRLGRLTRETLACSVLQAQASSLCQEADAALDTLRRRCCTQALARASGPSTPISSSRVSCCFQTTQLI